MLEGILQSQHTHFVKPKFVYNIFPEKPVPLAWLVSRYHNPSIPASYKETIPMSEETSTVGVIMGSQSDWATMRHAVETLGKLGISYEQKIVSAHRTPDRLYEYARAAESRGLKVIIAGAGGSAHLPGMVASLTTLPVFGVPIESQSLKGLDSLMSIVQMPGGIPVGTMAIGKAGAINAALLAGAVISLFDEEVAKCLRKFRTDQTKTVPETPTDNLP